MPTMGPLRWATVTKQDTSRSYDDLPESDVATVLHVPLLWNHGDDSAVIPASERHRKPGRHRAPVPAARRQVSRPTPPWHTTARVGLVSAVLVLGLFTTALLALAIWLP